MKVLSIGNSFSQDAQRYLYDIAKINGYELMTVNLFIGGCSLRTHYLNMLDDEKVYQYEINGKNTGLKVSLREVLRSNEWDIVTLQQASHESFSIERYVPYIYELKQYIKKYTPHCKIYLHQTWGYPAERPRLQITGFETTEDMFNAIQDTYSKVSNLIEADGIIPSGEAMLRAYKLLGESVYRDEIHANMGLGRYLLGLVWFKALFGMPSDFKHISEFDAPLSEEELQVVYDLF